jgi:hypothetical protein
VLDRNRRPLHVRAGTRFAEGKCVGQHPAEAMRDAVDNFFVEFDREPNQDLCALVVVFTSFETFCTLYEQEA